MTVLSLPMEADQLVPHRLPMRLVDSLVACDDQGGVVETEIGRDHALVDENGILEPVILVELIAQGYAVFRGYTDRLAGLGVRRGLLVGVKRLECFGRACRGDRLRIKTRTVVELEDFAVAEGEVWRGTELLASGEIKVWVQEGAI